MQVAREERRKRELEERESYTIRPKDGISRPTNSSSSSSNTTSTDGSTIAVRGSSSGTVRSGEGNDSYIYRLQPPQSSSSHSLLSSPLLSSSSSSSSSSSLSALYTDRSPAVARNSPHNKGVENASGGDVTTTRYSGRLRDRSPSLSPPSQRVQKKNTNHRPSTTTTTTTTTEKKKDTVPTWQNNNNNKGEDIYAHYSQTSLPLSLHSSTSLASPYHLTTTIDRRIDTPGLVQSECKNNHPDKHVTPGTQTHCSLSNFVSLSLYHKCITRYLSVLLVICMYVCVCVSIVGWRVYVSRIPMDWTSSLLQELFAQFGSISDVFIPNNNHIGKGYIYGFVDFKHQDSRRYVLEQKTIITNDGIKLLCRLPTSERPHNSSSSSSSSNGDKGKEYKKRGITNDQRIAIMKQQDSRRHKLHSRVEVTLPGPLNKIPCWKYQYEPQGCKLNSQCEYGHHWKRRANPPFPGMRNLFDWNSAGWEPLPFSSSSSSLSSLSSSSFGHIASTCQSDAVDAEPLPI